MKIYGIYKDNFFKVKPGFLPAKLWRVICNRANPRTEEQMRQIFKEKFPEGIFNAEIPKDIRVEDRIVLVYSDSIGLGFTAKEMGFFFSHQLEVLNGRRRHFHMTFGHWIIIILKRFFEITFLPEIIFLPFLLAYAAICSFLDGMKGRA